MNVKDSTNELNKSHKKGKKRTENIILPHEAKLSSTFNDDELKNKTKAAFREKSSFTQGRCHTISETICLVVFPDWKGNDQLFTYLFDL